MKESYNDSRREAIIKAAIRDTLGQNISVFTAADVLTVANIDQSDVERLALLMDSEITRISEESKERGKEAAEK